MKKFYRKKILCALPQVSGGGAERFFITFLQHVDRTQYNLEVVLVKKGGGFEHEIPDDISVHVLTERSLSSKLLAPIGPLRYVLALMSLIRDAKPDAIISFGSLFNGAVALASHWAKFVNPVLIIEAIHESSEISAHHDFEKWFRSIFLRYTYPLASKIIAVSEDVAIDIRKTFGITENIEIIHYGVNLRQIRNLAEESVNHPWLSSSRQYKVIVACGRLVQQKGFNILIEAMYKVMDDVKLILIGDGEERAKIETQIKRLKLQEKVDLVGYQRNPFRFIAKADFFVMPSLWEGFGLVLLEALAVGTPVIASDCPSGPRMILGNDRYGVLVPPEDPDSLTRRIKQLICNQKQQDILSRAAIQRAEDFSASNAVNKYLNILSEIGGWQ